MTTSSIGPGTVLGGRYRLDDLLSESAGARFWRGTDTVLARNVAIHALPSEDARAGALLEAARRSATVLDPHLLRVLDCDDADGVTWVVNEWGSGASLDILLERGPLPASRAAWLTREVAETIAVAHDAGVCHGRLTPECVLVTEAGSVKLIGFVLASAIENGNGASSTDHGTGYGSLDERERDVIDLAGILYAAVTGRWPGVSPSAVPRAPRDAKGPLRPRQVRAGVPRTLDAICERVLRREAHEHVMPIERAQEIVAALSDFVGEQDAPGPDGVAAMFHEPTVAIRRDQLPAAVAAPAAPAPSTDQPEASAAPAPELDETQAAPLPPFEEHPERPLFASTERRRPVPQAEPGTDAWLYGEAPPPAQAATDDGADDREPSPARRWLRVALVVGVVIVVLAAMAVAFNFGKGKDNSGATTNPGASRPTRQLTPVRPVAVHDFDPEGNPPTENPSEVRFATDGDPSTAWRTSTYRGNPALGGLKDGVGLLLDLGSVHPLNTVVVQLVGQPTEVSLYASPAGVNDPPAQIGDLRKVAGQTVDNTKVTFRLAQPVRSRFLVVWLTRLPAVPGGFQGQIAEISALA